MVLQEKLKIIRMATFENVASSLTEITQVRDKLRAVGEKVNGNELVQTTLNGMIKRWVFFVEAILSRENIPSWDHLWDDFMQE